MILAPLSALLVEDNPGDVVLFRESVRDTAVSVADVGSLEGALAHLAERPVDVVLLDLSLPDSDGLDTFARLHEAHPTVPVVVLTGLDDEEVALDAVGLGAQDYLVKGSVGPALLHRAIRYAHERWQLEHRLRTNMEQLRGLMELGHHALQGTPADRLLEETCDLACDVLDADDAFAAIGLEEPSTSLVGSCSTGTVPEPGILDAVWREIGTGPVLSPAPLAENGIADGGSGWQSLLAVPIGPPETPTGFLCVGSAKEGRFDAEHVRFLDGLADAVATARARAVTQAQLIERVKEQTALFTVTRHLQGEHDVSDVVDLVATVLRDAMQWPEATKVTVRIDDAVADAPRPGPAGPVLEDHVLRAPIQVADTDRGGIEVGYTAALPLLVEEQQMVTAIGEALGVWLARRDSHDRLASASARLGLLLDQIPGVVWSTDRDLTILDVTGAGVSRLPLPPDRYVGRPVGELTGTDNPLAPSLAAHREALAGRSAAFELELGGRFWRCHTEPMFDAANRIVGVAALGLDDTETRRQQRALEDSRRRLQAQFDYASDMIVLTDVDGRFVDVNPAALELIGRRRDQVIGTHAPPGAGLDVDSTEALTVSLQQDGSAGGELTVRDPQGRHREIEFQTVADIVPGINMTIARDVTDRKEYERHLQAALDAEADAAQRLRHLNDMKSAFLTAVSHELRTPLTSVQGFAQLLRHRADELDPAQRDHLLERLMTNANRLEQLLADLLDLDRLERGILTVMRRDVDVGALIQRVVESVDANRHLVNVNVQAAVFATLDPARVERIVENLVVNAVRHTPSGSQVWVALDAGESDLVISVSDDGPGLPAQIRDQVFETFSVGESPASRVGGAGVGLSLVRMFARLHGGEAWVDDRPGGGAAFHVRLPRTPPAPDPAGPNAATLNAATPIAAVSNPPPSDESRAVPLDRHVAGQQ